MVFSNYVRIIHYDNQYTILYNTFNESIAMIENEYLCNNSIPEDILDQLNDLQMFLNDDEIERIGSEFENTISNLKIIVEITKNCNFSCEYCYQSEWNKNSVITEEVIESLLKYIENCFNVRQYKILNLDFFGGEPLLYKEKLLLLYGKISNLCDKHNVELKCTITSNCYLLDNGLMSKLKNTRVITTLSLKNDHNRKRHLTNKNETYDVITNNILKTTYLHKNGNSLEIRYNTDSNNINDFGRFLDVMLSIGIKADYKTAYIEEFGNRKNYINSLPFSEYVVWNSTTVIDELIKRDLRVLQKPQNKITPCYGYYGQNIKVFCDGKIGICNSYMPERSRHTIFELEKDISSIEKFLPEKREKLLYNNKCSRCYEKYLCGGSAICKNKHCYIGLIDPDMFIKKYVYYFLQEKHEMFEWKGV